MRKFAQDKSCSQFVENVVDLQAKYNQLPMLMDSTSFLIIYQKYMFVYQGESLLYLSVHFFGDCLWMVKNLLVACYLSSGLGYGNA